MARPSPVIQFGAVTFTGADIKSATVIEEFDPMSLTLPITTAEIEIYSENADFSLINPAGDYASLEYRQPMTVSEVSGTGTVFIGQFYLDTWENTSDTMIKLSCIDLLGVLDALTYDGWLSLTPVAAGVVIASILTPLGVDYDLDTDLAVFNIQGWIPICSYRETLQQIAVAIGATVTCTRRSNLKIAPTASLGVITRGIRSGVSHSGQTRMYQQRWRPAQWDLTTPTTIILKAEKGIDQSLTKRTQVTGVEVTSHNILSGTGSMELFNGALAAGDHKITFSQPIHDLTISGATITTSGANYASINVASTGTVVLTGLVYIDTAKVSGVYNTGLPAGTKTNVLTITDATLVNSTNVTDITQRVYDYYQKRLLQNVRLYAPTAQTGSMAIIETLYNQQIQGVVEKMQLNLSGGFIAQTDIVGVSGVFINELAGTAMGVLGLTYSGDTSVILIPAGTAMGTLGLTYSGDV